MSIDRHTSTIRLRVLFGDALSSNHVHNHLNGAYHVVDMHRFAPPWSLMCKIPAIMVPTEVQQALRPDELVAELKMRLARAREAIDHLRSDLDRVVTSFTSIEPDPVRPDPNLHPFVEATHLKKPGFAPVWEFQFNPYRLAVALLDEYEVFIITTMRSRVSAFTKLSRIHRKTKSMTVNVRLVESRIL